jgi:molybdopterin-guanine dinucleotide biosynthesis protein
MSIFLAMDTARICYQGSGEVCNMATKYAVYIASKQWKKVEEAIKDPEDTLIIEGFPKTDPEVSAIAVFATNVTTKKLQMLRRETPSK